MHFCISASASSTVVIDVMDFIGPSDPWFGCTVSAKDVLAQLRANPTAQSVELNINSGGGDVMEGFAMYDALLAFGKPVTVNIVGVCASMASVLAMIADTRNMSPNAMFMIHNPAGGTCGEAEDLRKLADVMDMYREKMLDIYEAKAKGSRKEIGAMMDAETWMDAKAAKKAGFVTDIVAKVATGDADGAEDDGTDALYPIAARADLSRCARVPANLIAARLAPTKKVNHDTKQVPRASSAKEKLMPLAELIKILGLPETATEAEVTAALLARAPAPVPSAEPAPAPSVEVSPDALPVAARAAVLALQASVTAANATSKALALEVAALHEKNRVGEITKILASNRGKCTPALEKWATSPGRTAAEVTEVLGAIPAGSAPLTAPPVEGQGPGKGDVKISAADREVMRVFGTSEEKFLAAKQTLAGTPRVQWENSNREEA